MICPLYRGSPPFGGFVLRGFTVHSSKVSLTYPVIIFDIHNSLFLDEVLHCSHMTIFSCLMQGSSLMERKKLWTWLTRIQLDNKPLFVAYQFLIPAGFFGPASLVIIVYDWSYTRFALILLIGRSLRTLRIINTWSHLLIPFYQCAYKAKCM